MPEPRIVVVGSSNTDLVVPAPRLPAAGETVLGGDLMLAAGGKGANQAVAAARLGGHVTFVACIGTDMFGQGALSTLRTEGLDLGCVRQTEDAPSGVALIVVDAAGHNLIAVAPGANSRLRPEDVAAAQRAIAGASVVLLQLETPLETVLAAAQAGRQAGALVVLNPAPAQPLPDALYRAVDVLTPNETEAALLTGESTPDAAANALLQRGPRIVLVTLGEAGVLEAEAGHPLRRLPAFPVAAVDTTAAGDAFCGALAVALARGLGLAGAVRYAQAAAALSVTRRGAQPSLPRAAEVDAFLSRQAPV